MRLLTSFFMAAACIGAAMASAQAAPGCAMPEEASGLNTRVLQTKLMVGALSCGKQKEYNAFVKKFRSALQEESNGMQSYFRRAHASRATAETDRFVTRLANDISQDAMGAKRSGFCEGISQLFGALEDIPAAKLATVSNEDSYAAQHRIGNCAKLARVE